MKSGKDWWRTCGTIDGVTTYDLFIPAASKHVCVYVCMVTMCITVQYVGVYSHIVIDQSPPRHSYEVLVYLLTF